MVLTKNEVVKIIEKDIQLVPVEGKKLYYDESPFSEVLFYYVTGEGTQMYVPGTEKGEIVTLVKFDEEGGHEGGGEYMHVIFGFKEHPDQFWKLQGRYSSWDSNDWDDVSDIIEVKPEIVPTIVYKPVD